MSNILIDTNILVYALDEDSLFHDHALSLIKDARLQLYITTKNISELFAVSSKRKINENRIFDFYNDIKIYIGILFPSSESLKIFEKLLLRYKPIGNKVFDFEIVSIMLANGIDHIVTFNKKDFQGIDEVKIFNS